MKKKAIIALVVAALMVIQMPMVALAAVTPHSHVSGAVDHGSESFSDGIIASGNSTECKTTGDVGYGTLFGKAIDASNGATVTAGNVKSGYTGINAKSGAIVTVESVESKVEAVTMSGDDTKVTVNGNVTANYNSSGITAAAVNGGKLKADDISATNTMGFSAALSMSKGTAEVGDVKCIGNDEAKSIAVNYAQGDVLVTSGDVVATGTLGAKGIYVSNSGNKSVNITTGKIKSTHIGVDASGKGTTVNVNGLVEAGSIGIDAKTGAIITTGNVESAGTGINVSGTGTKVNVNGSVKSTGAETDTPGIRITGENSEVVVTGDVNANALGVFINNSASAGGTVTVLETIKSGEYGVGVADASKDNYQLNVYKIECAEGMTFASTGGGTTKADDIAKNVNYIIKNASSMGSFTLSGTKAGTLDQNGTTYLTSKETSGDEVTINVATVDGYTFKSFAGNSAAFVKANDDGTYTLIVPRGGGVSLELVYEAIVGPTPGPTPEPTPQQTSGGGAWSVSPSKMGSAEAPVSNGAWANVNGAFRYTVNGDTVKNAIATIQYKAADGNTYTGSFYFDRNGTMQTGWQQIDGVWYYFNTAQGPTQGMMLTNTTTPDGYQVGANGAWIH